MKQDNSSLKIRAIRLCNIGNHIETVFEIPEKERLIAISGSTGSGKTTLCEAPFLALYGLSVFRSQNIYEIARRGHQGICEVEVIFENPQGEVEILRRWRQTSANSGSDHEVLWNGNVLKIKEFKERVDGLFGDLNFIRIANYSPQNRISFFSLPSRERKEVLGNLLAPYLFRLCDETSEWGKSNRRKTEKEIAVLIGKREMLTDELKLLQTKLQDPSELKRDLQRVVISRDKIRKKAKGVQEQAEAVKAELEELLREAKKKEEKRKRLQDLFREKKRLVAEEIKEMKSQVDQIHDLKLQLSQILVLIHADSTEGREAWEKELEQLQIKTMGFAEQDRKLSNSISKLNAEIGGLSRIDLPFDKLPCSIELRKNCPLAHQVLDIEKRISDSNQQLDILSEKLEKIRKQFHIVSSDLTQKSELSEKILGLTEKISKLEREEELRKAKNDKKRLVQDRLSQIETEELEIQKTFDSKNYPDSKVTEDSLVRYREEWRQLEGQNESMTKDIESLKVRLGIAENNSEKIQRFQEALDVSAIKIGSLNNDVVVNGLIESGFSKKGIQGSILQLELNILESLVNDYLSLVFPENEVSLSFRYQKKLKTIDDIAEVLDPIFSFDGTEFSCNDLSGGQRQATEIALRFGVLTFQSIQNPTNLGFCILDEPTSETDDQLSKNVVTAIQKLLDFYPQVFVVSYDENLMSAFPFRVQMGVTNGIARVSTTVS